MKPSERARARASRPVEGEPVATRAWFSLGITMLVVGAALSAIRAAPSHLFPDSFHLLVALSGAFLLAGGLAYGFASPFLKREIIAPRAALSPVVLAGGTLAALAVSPFGVPSLRVLTAAMGVAFLLLPLHLAVSAAWGRNWRGGVALFAKDQPFRHGDLAAAAAFGLGLVGFAAAGLLFLTLPRGLPSAGITVGMLGGLLPFFVGTLLFLLPRNAKRPMPGVTLVYAALVFQALGVAGLAIAFVRPVGADFRTPASITLLATLLVGVAMLRIQFPEKPGPQLVRARPFLSGAFVVAGLASVTLILAVLSGIPNALLPLTADVHLVLVSLLGIGCTLLGAPILLNAVPRTGKWGKWAAALAIMALFLIAPVYQYERSAFPGALVLLFAALLVAWGLAPMRRPRREC